MKDSMTNSNWLTESTKQKAMTKLDKFNVKIGYPDIWKDYSRLDICEGDTLYDISNKFNRWYGTEEFLGKLNTVLDRNEWLMTPQTVNAYFMPTQNEIVFPSAILQPPFYCKSITDIDFDVTDELELLGNSQDKLSDDDILHAVNLGAIGAVIAHEITHGYDDQGRKFDGDGNLNDWWTDEDAKLFTEKSELLKEQVNEYKFIDIDDSNKEHHMNAQLTMGENLADLGGISLSLQALNRKITDHTNIKILHRLFFKSFANVWKENSKKDKIINALTTDPHGPPDFRANLVRNMDEFYHAFNIRETDKMYLSQPKRLRMW